MSTDTLKTAICDALATWIRQRSGLSFGNYGDVTSYRSEMRGIAKDKRDAETLLQAVRWRDSITGEKLIEASKHAFSGRLTFKVDKFWLVANGDKTVSAEVEIDYTTGQYWPTEYRKAAAAVLASALWEHARDADNGSGYAAGFKETSGREPDGNELRTVFRKEFGSALQRRWFN